MIVALIIGLLFSGSSENPGEAYMAALKVRIEQAIDNPDKEKNLLSIVEEMEKESKSYSKELASGGKKMAKLNKNYASTQDEFSTLLSGVNSARVKTQEKMVEYRYKLRELMTPDEWKKVFPAPAK
jgi:hypothetical protein